MEINLTPILSREGGRLPVNLCCEPKSSPKDLFSFTKPVAVTGEAVNIGGGIALNVHITAELRFSCDRCGTEAVRTFETDAEEVLEKEETAEENGDNNPDAIRFSGYTVDLDDIVYQNVFMSLPAKLLCREDCKGLCPVCGKNLNLEPCECDKQVTDPRFDILDKFFE